MLCHQNLIYVSVDIPFNVWKEFVPLCFMVIIICNFFLMKFIDFIFHNLQTYFSNQVWSVLILPLLSY